MENQEGIKKDKNKSKLMVWLLQNQHIFFPNHLFKLNAYHVFQKY